MATATSHVPRLMLFVLDSASGRPLRWISVHTDVVGVEVSSRGCSDNPTLTVDALLRESPAFAAVARRAVAEAMDMTANHRITPSRNLHHAPRRTAMRKRKA